MDRRTHGRLRSGGYGPAVIRSAGIDALSDISGFVGAKATPAVRFISLFPSKLWLFVFTNGYRRRVMQTKSRCYHVVYDDDLDTWSVVRIPFDGVYFAGTKPQCVQFVAHHDINFNHRRNPRTGFDFISPLGMSAFARMFRSIGYARATS
jgi:hypothetical protein